MLLLWQLPRGNNRGGGLFYNNFDYCILDCMNYRTKLRYAFTDAAGT